MHHALHFYLYFHCVSAKIEQGLCHRGTVLPKQFLNKPISFGLCPVLDIFSAFPLSGMLLIYGGQGKLTVKAM